MSRDIDAGSIAGSRSSAVRDVHIYMIEKGEWRGQGYKNVLFKSQRQDKEVKLVCPLLKHSYQTPLFIVRFYLELFISAHS